MTAAWPSTTRAASGGVVLISKERGAAGTPALACSVGIGFAAPPLIIFTATKTAITTSNPATESAMERRGPAGSLRPQDRALIETWEGDVRVAQLSLRQAARRAPPSPLAALLARLRGGRQTGR